MITLKPEDTIDFHIKSSWLLIANLYDYLAQELEISRATCLVLYNINEKTETPATKIAPIMGMQNTSLSRLLKQMEEDNLIIRKVDEIDKRCVNIGLSKKGKETRKNVQKVVREFNAFLRKHIDEKEMEKFFKVIIEIENLTAEYKTQKIKLNEEAKNK